MPTFSVIQICKKALSQYGLKNFEKYIKYLHKLTFVLNLHQRLMSETLLLLLTHISFAQQQRKIYAKCIEIIDADRYQKVNLRKLQVITFIYLFIYFLFHEYFSLDATFFCSTGV